MNDLTIIELQRQMDHGELTAVMLTQYYLERINSYDQKFNSVFEVAEDALECARQLDQERVLTGKRSMLHGIPILLKDNINSAGHGLHTTAGSIVLKDVYSPYNATVVEKLEAAGAIVLGKVNLSEFANFISNDSPNGYSALSGQVKNPYGPFDVGGSSSGSGVSVALDFCQVAIGTETSGSIISPAASNSVVGVKPTVGLISRHGIVPISWTQDTAGPMARNVVDAAITLKVMCGPDEKDPITTRHKSATDYLSHLVPDALKGVRIGLPMSFSEDYKEDQILTFQKAVEELKTLGAVIVEVEIDKAAYCINWDLLYYEFPKAIESYLNTLGHIAPVHTLKEIVSFNLEDLKVRVPYDQEVFERCLKIADCYEQDYKKELENSVAYGKEIDRVLDQHQLEALIFPDTEGADIAARVGYPSVTVPAGYTSNNQPVGLTFTSKSFTESTLLAYAYAYEKAYPKRKAPLLEE